MELRILTRRRAAIVRSVPLFCHSMSARLWGKRSRRRIRRHMYTRGASPRRADVRLGSGHARNGQGCRQIEAVDATELPSSPFF